MNQHQWDRLVLYLFMIIQRLRNCHNFIWYALINGASTWSNKAGNMDVHLGLCLTRHSILRKLHHHHFTRAEVEQLIIARLIQEVICIGSFDNTQLFQLLKYQREGHSSNAHIITSLLFLLATIPKNHSLDFSLNTSFVFISSRWKDVSGAEAVAMLVFNVFSV
jgi:hypothetical protein